MNTLLLAYSKLRAGLFLFVKYRLHLSMIYYFLLVYNNVRVGGDLNMPLILSFTCWHFGLFLFDRVYDREIDKEAQPDEFVPENQAKFLYAVVALLVFTSLVFYLSTDFPIKYWLILLPLTFLYPLRIYRGKRIKSFLLIKNLYSALLIYSMPIYLHAYLVNGLKLPEPSVYLPIFSLFVYVIIGEMFWDIRDTSVDLKHGTQTLPNTIGLWPTKILLGILILGDAYTRNWNFTESAYIYFVLLSFVKESTDRLVFHFPPLIALLRFLT